MKALRPIGSHQELGIEPSFVLLEVFLRGFSVAAKKMMGNLFTVLPRLFHSWKRGN